MAMSIPIRDWIQTLGLESGNKIQQLLNAEIRPSRAIQYEISRFSCDRILELSNGP